MVADYGDDCVGRAVIEEPAPFEYDPHDLRPPKKPKRISAFTGKPTRLNPETELQIACVAFYDKLRLVNPTLRHFTRLFAVGAAEGNIPPYLRVLMKRMGKRAGIFDLHFLDKRAKRFQQTWIECKVGRNDYTPGQKEYLDWLSDTPIRAVQVRSLDEFRSVIDA